MGLFTHPILTVKVLGIMLWRFVKASVEFMARHYLIIIGLVSLIAGFLYAPGPHEVVSN